MMTIINQVLEMARIESGTATLRLKAEDLSAIFHDVSSVFESDIRKKNLQYSIDANVCHKYAICDKTKLQEIYLNIVGNAVKYTPSGKSIHVIVKEIASDDKMAQYCFICEDTGIGMSEEYLPHIFEEFSREHTSTENKVVGTGLGLPIVKSLIELMGGNIKAESSQEVGTKFTVTISLETVSKEDVYKEQEKQPNTDDIRGKRILLAEDNELNAEIAIELLHEEGFFVELATDGQECFDMLDQAEEGYYDLILMDIQMPNVNGYEATVKIRQMENDKKAQIPIVAMTANVFAEDRKLAVPAFASEDTSSAEETVEETSEASSTEESESEGVGDVLANLEGTYEELFPVIADAKYDDLWLGFCAQYGDEENAQLYSDMLKGSTTALIYGAEAVDTYAENPDDTAFDCYFLHGIAQFTVEGNTISGTDADGEEVFSHTYTYIGDAEDGSFAIYKSDDENSGDFTYFAFAADTPDTTYHIEFRYGYTEYKINSFYDGDYAYWMASGIKKDASEDVISDCVELFCSENLAE